MAYLKFILALIYIALAVVLIIIVLLQESKEGLTGVISGTAETFLGQNKALTPDARKRRFTAYAATAFIILSLILSYIVIHG